MGLLSKVSNFLNRKDSVKYFWKVRTKALGGNFIVRYTNKYKYRKLLGKYCSMIPLGAKFDGMPSLPHGLNGIFISAGAVIGKNCTIFQQVTIGSNTLKDSGGTGTPVIGDNVYIGAGAKIIGGVKIGNNVRIGANCVVVKDVPDNCTVVLEKPRVIYHEEARDNKYRTFEQYESAKEEK